MAEDVPQCAVEKEFERKRAYDIVTQLDREQFSLATCEWAMRGYASIAAQAMLQKNTESMADFLDDGGCESLVAILDKYGEVSDRVAAFGCQAIGVLSWSLRELKEFLGEIGACESVVFATSMHIGDPHVSEFGSFSIGQLAKQNISNSFKLAQSGACDLLAQVGNFGFSLRQENCVRVARNVCYAFAQLSEAVNAARLLDCGAGPLVCELSKLHALRDRAFARCAVHSLCALSSLNAQHREELGRCGACDLVVRIVQAHGSRDQQIALEGCEAMMHLSLSPNNADKLGACGACELVVQLLKNALLDVEFGCEVCTGAMCNLATFGQRAPENRSAFLRAQCVEMLKRAQFSPKASYKARENIQSLLDVLGAENVTSKVFAIQSQSNSSSSNATADSAGNSNRRSQSMSSLKVIHGSEMKGSTVPLHVEVREVFEYDSFATDSPSSGSSSASGPAQLGSALDDANEEVSPLSFRHNDNGVLEI